MKQPDFPIYRKYAGIETYFKILSEKHFIELKKLGKRYLVHEVEAKQYPEMLLIQDMLACQEGRWEEVTEEAFESRRENQH